MLEQLKGFVKKENEGKEMEKEIKESKKYASNELKRMEKLLGFDAYREASEEDGKPWKDYKSKLASNILRLTLRLLKNDKRLYSGTSNKDLIKFARKTIRPVFEDWKSPIIPYDKNTKLPAEIIDTKNLEQEWAEKLEKNKEKIENAKKDGKWIAGTGLSIPYRIRDEDNIILALPQEPGAYLKGTGIVDLASLETVLKDPKTMDDYILWIPLDDAKLLKPDAKPGEPFKVVYKLIHTAKIEKEASK
jgi:hypothetical protein